jgi:type II secretory pathway pseudopilin PulG
MTITRRCGVTLVELLVVTGIIIVLSAIVFSVMGGAKNQAAFMKCSSHLGQIGKAAALYANEYDHLSPPVKTDSTMPNITGTEEAIRVKGDPKRWRDLHNVYLNNEDVFYCPHDVHARSSAYYASRSGKRSNEFTSYESAPLGWTVLRDGSAMINFSAVEPQWPYARDVILKHLERRDPPILTAHGNWIVELAMDGSVKRVTLTD